jgi:hypothetical protein
LLTVIDELQRAEIPTHASFTDRGTFSRQSLNGRTQGTSVVRPERRWSSAKVIEAQADVMLLKGVPEHISFRSANSLQEHG